MYMLSGPQSYDDLLVQVNFHREIIKFHEEILAEIHRTLNANDLFEGETCSNNPPGEETKNIAAALNSYLNNKPHVIRICRAEIKKGPTVGSFIILQGSIISTNEKSSLSEGIRAWRKNLFDSGAASADGVLTTDVLCEKSPSFLAGAIVGYSTNGAKLLQF